MAKEALEKVEEQLNCSICLDTYTAPKLLQCFHTYCQQCLVPLVVRDQQGKLGLTCPTCRQVTPIPASGVAGLQPAFHITHLLEIHESLQESDDPAETLEGAALNPVKNVGHCCVHEGKELELYCETCGELICARCALKGGKHRGHSYEELDQAYEKYKEEITPCLKPLEDQMAVTKKALVQLDTHRKEIIHQQRTIEENIYSSFVQLQEAFNVRKTELVDRLHRVTQSKLKNLAAQRKEIETALVKLSSCLHFVKESLRPGKEEMIKMKMQTAKQAEEVTTSFQPDALEPNERADVSFTPPGIALARSFGHLHTPGSSTLITDRVVQPWGVAITRKGEVVVTEWEGCRVSVFSSRREKLRSFGSRGSGRRQFQNPRGVAVDGKGNILVADSGNNRIQKFTPEGHFLAVKKTNNSGTSLLSPTGIAFNARNNMIYVAAQGGNHCVQVLDSDLNNSSSFGEKGSGEGQFDDPQGVACDSTGNVYVADRGNHNIQVFTANGKFLRTFGRRGQGRGELKEPVGVAIDTSNKVYVSEVGNNRVSVFTSDSQFVTFRRRGSYAQEDFRSPQGLAVDKCGVVYVCTARESLEVLQLHLS